MTSGNPALVTIAPQARQLTLAGQPVFVGKLKLRQKAQLQHWLDELPEPNQRIKDALAASGVTAWPIGVESLAFLMDADVHSRIEFLRIALAPFNPGMSGDDIDRLAGECSSDDEFLDILFTAFGRARKTAEPADPKGDGPDVGGQI